MGAHVILNMVESGMIRFECPSCGVHIRVPEANAGKRGKCPKCRHRVTVPVPDTQDDFLRLEPLDIPAAPEVPVDTPFSDESEASEDLAVAPAGQRSHPWPIDIFMYPMGLLAMVLYQDSSALNPFKLLLAIMRSLLSYTGLVMLLAGVLGLFMLLSHIPILGEFLSVYGSFILAHLLGRFYWKNQARIGWF